MGTAQETATPPKRQAPAKKPAAAKKKAARKKAPVKKKAAAKSTTKHSASAGSEPARVRKLQERLNAAVKTARARAADRPQTANILGIKGTSKTAPFSLPVAVENGLPFSSVERLAQALNLSTNALAEDYLGISRPTLSRRRKAGKLTQAESDGTVRYARLLELATELMEGDDAAAIQWLNTPLSILQRQTPLTHARTEAGAREVDILIGRLEHGVYS